jgi:hypothetical protein
MRLDSDIIAWLKVEAVDIGPPETVAITVQRPVKAKQRKIKT